MTAADHRTSNDNLSSQTNNNDSNDTVMAFNSNDTKHAITTSVSTSSNTIAIDEDTTVINTGVYPTPSNCPSSIGRLALNLLTQIEPSSSSTSMRPTLKKPKIKNNNYNNYNNYDDEEDDDFIYNNVNNNKDDNAIRQVLISISTAQTTSLPSNGIYLSRGINNGSNSRRGTSDTKEGRCDDTCVGGNSVLSSSASVSSWWTEGRLVEWLIRRSSLELSSSSSSSADRYWSTMLLQSPDARRYIVDLVIYSSSTSHDERGGAIPFFAAGATGTTTRTAGTQKSNKPSRNIHNSSRCRRRNRICTIPNDDHNDIHSNNNNNRQYESIYRSLKDPWWDPNDNNVNVKRYDNNDDVSSINASATKSSISTTTSESSSSSSSIVFREWVQCLATSQNPTHLHSLRILLAEATGRNGLNNSASNQANRSGNGSSTVIDGDDSSANGCEEVNHVWWELCYPSIATTIQRIVYRKLIYSENSHSGHNNNMHLSQQQKLMKEKKAFNNASSGTATAGSNVGVKSDNTINSSNRKHDRRYRIGKIKDRLQQLPMIGIVVMPNNKIVAEDSNTSMEIDLDYEPDTTYIEQKYGYSKEEDDEDDGTLHNRADNVGDNFNSIRTVQEEEEENRVLALALSVWIGLLQVSSSSEMLNDWYADREGLGGSAAAAKISRRNKRRGDPAASPPCGGLFMVNILLDLLEELQFVHWMHRNDESSSSIRINDRNSMSSSQILASGSRNVVIDNDVNNIDPSSNIDSVEHSDADDFAPSSSIPLWYNAAIAVLTQIGRTENGMELLRSRSIDDRESDWMGNALDVSIRQLHTLALHLDDVQTSEGSIVRLGKSECNDAVNKSSSNSRIEMHYCDEDPHTARLLRSVEAWVRLWHQVLLFVHHRQQKQQHQQEQQREHQKEGGAIITFLSLVLDLRDYYTSSCAILMTSEMIRPEIRSLIRWQLDELLMDEEDYEE